MSRDDGFAIMDISTSLVEDPKFRTLARRHPAQLAAAGWAYVGLLATSWREGERLTLEEGWPVLLPWDPEAAEALREVGLVDDETRVPGSVWDGWFGVAFQRRALGRERQHRADVKRGRIAPSGPPSSVRPSGPTDRPSVRPSGPSSDQHRSNAGPSGDHVVTTPTNGRNPAIPAEGPCRICGGQLTDGTPGAIVGPGWIQHAEHPEDYAVPISDATATVRKAPKGASAP